MTRKPYGRRRDSAILDARIGELRRLRLFTAMELIDTVSLQSRQRIVHRLSIFCKQMSLLCKKEPIPKSYDASRHSTAWHLLQEERSELTKMEYAMASSKRRV